MREQLEKLQIQEEIPTRIKTLEATLAQRQEAFERERSALKASLQEATEELGRLRAGGETSKWESSTLKAEIQGLKDKLPETEKLAGLMKERLEAEQRALEQELARLESQIAADETSREDLSDKWSSFALEFKEISGNLRVTARDLEQILTESPMTTIR